MKLTAQSLTLRLRTPFRIAHGTSEERQNVMVTLGDGLGEGALPPYYGFSLKTCLDYLLRIDADALLDGVTAGFDRTLATLPPGPLPARTALDIALHDVWARTLGCPLYAAWGLDAHDTPLSCRTVDIQPDTDTLRMRLRELRDAPIIKLKIGTGDIAQDEALVRTARETTQADLCVDANGAWTHKEAVEIIPRLAAYNLRFIEQPIAADSTDDWHLLRRFLPLHVPPLIADESVRNCDDIIVLAGAADGINIKLTKAGGLREARHMITVARALDMKVMIGCMIESSVGITAAAHLAPLADFVDLDGALFLANDPFHGVLFDHGRLIFTGRPGTGRDETVRGCERPVAGGRWLEGSERPVAVG